jgi:hypothetical protein
VDDNKLIERITARGHKFAKVAIRDYDGMMIYEVNDTFVFREDLQDLAEGTATIQEIIERNKGKVFPNAPSQ